MTARYRLPRSYGVGLRLVVGIIWLAQVGVILSACGPSLSLTVPPDLIRRLPKNSRRSVFQAETVVTIAVDRRSSVQREIGDVKREIQRTKEKIRDAEKRQNKADGAEAEKIDMEIEVWEAKIDYLEEKVDHLGLRLELADRELILARAQFELSKAKLVKKHKINYDTSEEEFIEQVRDIQGDVDEFRGEVEEDAARLKECERDWLKTKDRFYSSMGQSGKGWWTE